MLLVVVTLIAYWPVLRCGFVEFDDPAYVSENTHVQQGLTWAGLFWAISSTEQFNWHPLTWISHMADTSLFGHGPAGPHAVNLLLHVANSALLFLLLTRFTGALWRSGLVAALFALHPLHVESVAWISERKDLLSAWFFFLTLWAYGEYTGVRNAHAAQRPPGKVRAWYLAALALFGLGLASKPMLVTTPFVLLLLDFWPLRRFPSADAPTPTPQPTLKLLLLEKTPFLTLAIASSLITVFAQKQGGAVATFTEVSLTGRVQNSLVAYARYLGKTLWPDALAMYYPHPGHWPAAAVAGAGGILLAFTLAAWLVRKRSPFVLVGWLWFLGTLIPVIGIVQVGGQSMADRYTYLPLVGIFVIFSWGAWECASRVPAIRQPLTALVLLSLALLGWTTHRQAAFWENSETLYLRTLAVTAPNPTVSALLAHYYCNQGNAARESGDLAKAESFYLKALAHNSEDAQAHNHLGLVYQARDKVDRAIMEHLRAIQCAPGNANAHNNLAVAYSRLGKTEEAIAHLEESLKLEPGSAGARNNLAALLAKAGKLQAALTNYQEAARLAPDNASILINLGDLFAKLGRDAEAGESWRKALEIEPNNARARQRLDLLGKEKN
jgi:tetratricopeptide (TPR) repeat protein